MRLKSALNNRQRGQGMTEYIIIVALIAIAAIAVYQYFGQSIRNQTAAVAQEISGNDGTAAQAAAAAAADKSATTAVVKRDLSNYTDNKDK
jgi:type IV pilus assembly protein PilA